MSIASKLLDALLDARQMLIMCYDVTEDNENNPNMQEIGRTIKGCDQVIAEARKHPEVVNGC